MTKSTAKMTSKKNVIFTALQIELKMTKSTANKTFLKV